MLEIGGTAQPLLAPFVEGSNRRLFVIDTRPPDTLSATADRIERRKGDPFVMELPAGIDLCVVAPGLARGPDVLEDLLYEQIYPALSDGGVVAVQFCRDATDDALRGMKVSHSRVRELLQSFLKNQFGVLALPDSSLLEQRFAHCAFFEFLGWAPRSKRAVSEDPIVWLVLRKRSAVPAKVGEANRKGLPRTPRQDQFPQSEFAGFLKSWRDAGISLFDVGEFSTRYEAYYDEDAGDLRAPERPFGHVKFDIHGNIRRALELARIMAAFDYQGLFLMMQRHPLNQDYYDAESTWDMLREIRDLGHEVGLHADIYHFIRSAGDFYTGLDAALTDMRKRGFAIRAASLHGDSTAHIKAERLQANDFFTEPFRRTKWSKRPPHGEEFLAEHVNRYSRTRIATDFGLTYFSEVNFVRDGLLVNRAPMLNISDNARALEVCNWPKTSDRFVCPTPFRVQKEWAQKAVWMLTRRPFLALFHPQWYW